MANDHGNLLRKAIAGDRVALAALLEQHAPALRRRLAGMLPQRWRSLLSEDDVLQQTYVDAVRDIGSLLKADESSFACWLESLARRNLVDAVRMLEASKRGGNRRRLTDSGDDNGHPSLLEVLAATAATPSRAVARDEARVLLRRAVDALPGQYKQVVELYDLRGLPVEEVAKTLQRSCGAVYMLRARAHRVLCGMMGRASNYLSSSA